MSSRDLALERESILQAARAYGFDGAGVLALTRERAGDGPVRDPEHRDFTWEAIEEAADGLNYGSWLIERLLAMPESEARDAALLETLEMMRCFAGAYYRARRVRELLAENANGPH